MKNVLFIVYYFPPMGGSGVQRPLKFIKYLREFGWNPIILCPEPGMYSVFDESLNQELQAIAPEIHQVKGNTPFHVFGGERKTADYIPNFITGLIKKFFRLTMYPDNKKGWVKPALDKAKELIRDRDIDLIFSTAPPFSNHMIGARLSAQTGLPLVLDYRDSWMQNQFFTDLYGWQKSKMKQLEGYCVSKADVIIGLDDITLKSIKENHSLRDTHFEIVQHGFDPDDFHNKIPPTLSYTEGAFNLLYSGTFVEHNQPDTFLKGVAHGVKQEFFTKNDIHLHFQGGLNTEIRNMVKELGLQTVVTEYPYMDHKKAVANLMKADALWVLENYDPDLSQIKNGKLFEYFGAQKPILGVLNSGVSEQLIKEYNAGYIADVQTPHDIAYTLKTMVSDWKKKSIKAPNQDFVERYNRKKLTKKLANIFDEISPH